MAKILSILLFVAAVVVAIIYLVKGKRIEKQDIQEARGWKRHLLAATALILALAGGIGLGNGETDRPAAAPDAQVEDQDEVAGAWAGLRAAWRKIDKYSSEGPKELPEEREAKRKEHGEVVKVLVDNGALSQSAAGVLDQTFESTTHSAFFRGAAKGVGVKCYKMTLIGGASIRAQGQLAKSAMHVAELEAVGKLSPAVIEKTRKQIARDMRMIMYAESRPSHKDAQALLEAYGKGEKIDIPAEVKQAADVLMQLLTSDEPPAVTDEKNTSVQAAP